MCVLATGQSTQVVLAPALVERQIERLDHVRKLVEVLFVAVLLQLPLKNAPHRVTRVNRQIIRGPADIVDLVVVALEHDHRVRRRLIMELEHAHCRVIRQRVELAPIGHFQHSRPTEPEIAINHQVADENVHKVHARLTRRQQVQSRRVQAHLLHFEIEALAALDGHFWSAHLGS